MNELPKYELTIDDINYDGVTAISIVKFPALEENFMLFSKEKCNFTISKSNIEKRIVTGPALIPDKEIYRFNYLTGEEYNVYFSKDTVNKIAENFLIQNKNSNITLEHQANINDVSVVESWIVNNSKNDKSNELGFKINDGTWMVSLKINNDEIWENIIKEGKVKGFSIEGWFTTKFDKYSKDVSRETLEKDEEDEKAKSILEQIKEIIKNIEDEEK